MRFSRTVKLACVSAIVAGALLTSIDPENIPLRLSAAEKEVTLTPSFAGGKEVIPEPSVVKVTVANGLVAESNEPMTASSSDSRAGESLSPVRQDNLSQAIAARALSEIHASAQPSSGASSYLAGMVANAAGNANATPLEQNSRALQGNVSIESLMPTLPFDFANGALTGTFSPSATNVQYRDNNTIGKAGFGFGFMKPEKDHFMSGGQLELGTMASNQIAIGTNMGLYENRRDLVFNGIWQVPDSGFRFKASGGYMWGDQNFDFPSGTANIDLEQFSYAFSTNYIIPRSDQCSCLHSVGLTVWGAHAHQMSGLDSPRYFTVPNGSGGVLLYRDPLKLAEGRLVGASADTQIAFLPNLVGKGSLGYEQLEFPFANGTREIDRSAYYNVEMLYEPLPDLLLGTQYRSGAGENRIGVSAETGSWLLNAFHTKGQNGLADNNGAILTFRLGASSAKKKGNLALRMQPSRGSDTSTLLAEAIARPAYLPQTFLAKVDPTALVLEANIAVPGVLVKDGDIYLIVGHGTPTVTGVTRAVGSGPKIDYPYSQLVTSDATYVIVHPRAFPKQDPGSFTYEISVTDGDNHICLAIIKTQTD